MVHVTYFIFVYLFVYCNSWIWINNCNNVLPWYIHVVIFTHKKWKKIHDSINKETFFVMKEICVNGTMYVLVIVSYMNFCFICEKMHWNFILTKKICGKINYSLRYENFIYMLMLFQSMWLKSLNSKYWYCFVDRGGSVFSQSL